LFFFVFLGWDTTPRLPLDSTLSFFSIKLRMHLFTFILIILTLTARVSALLGSQECPQHHGHKGDPGVTPGICGAIGERDQVILMWVTAPGV
jgi:hypothetical protein